MTRILKPINIHKPVQVYKNSRRKCWSVTQSGKLVAYTDQILLHNVNYLVRASGRERTRIEKRKNVHAFVVGFMSKMVNSESLCRIYDPVKIGYDPYKNETFVDNGNNAVLRSEHALLCMKNGVVAMGVQNES